jgi:hypothetical protein
MILKFTGNNDFDFDCESVVLLKDSGKELKKRASAKSLLKYEKTPNQEDLHIIAVGSYEGTGCFFKGAPVQTINGIKPIEDIKVGDLVLTHKGRYRKVLKTYENDFSGVKVSLDIVSLCDRIECTDNHPIQVIKAVDFRTKHRCPSLLDDGVNPKDVLDDIISKATYIPASEIKPGDYVLTPINIDNEDKKEVFSEDDAYLFGYYLAEGCLAKEYREDRSHCGEYTKILFTMAVGDQPCIDKIQSIIKKLNGAETSIQKSFTSEYGRRFSFQNYEKAQQCLKLFGCHSTIKFLSPIIFQQSIEWKLKFLAAYFDGDGHVIGPDSNGAARYIGSMSASTASRNLAYDLHRLLASCGITSNVYKGMNKHSNGCFGKTDHVIYTVGVGSCHSNKILQYTLRLAPSSKQPKYLAGRSWISSNHLVLQVGLVELSEIEDTIKYNLEVEEDNTYVVDIQVHNSNRNGDCFLEKDCIKNHHYFSDSKRAVHRHHQNKPNDPKYGTIKASAYNDKMRRIELVVGLDRDKCADILDEQERTGNTNWSMAAKMASDLCSWCGHRAKTENDRCDCVKNHLGEINKEGEMCRMINTPDPRWFEISYVRRPADRIGMSLSKLASDLTYKPLPPSHFLNLYSDIYIPDELMISKKASDKRELLTKLAELEKYVDAVTKGNPVTSKDKFIKEHGHKLKHTPNIDSNSIDSLRKLDPGTVLKTLADHGIVLKPEDFSRYVFDDKVKPERVEGMKTHLPHIYNKLDNDKAVNSETFDPSLHTHTPHDLDKTVKGLEEGHSLKEGPVVRRLMIVICGSGNIKREEQEPTKEACDLEFAKKYAEYQLASLNYINEQGKLTDDILLNTILMNQ